MTWAPGKMFRKVFARNVVDPVPPAEQMQTQASIYLGTTSVEHIAELSRAVDNLINALDYNITEKDPPEHGSWFRRLRLGSDPSKERWIHARLAELDDRAQGPTSSEQMAALGNVLSALKNIPTAVIRIGAMVIIKVDDDVHARVLTPAQLQALDQHPEAVRNPVEMQAFLAKWDRDGAS